MPAQPTSSSLSVSGDTRSTPSTLTTTVTETITTPPAIQNSHEDPSEPLWVSPDSFGPIALGDPIEKYLQKNAWESTDIVVARGGCRGWIIPIDTERDLFALSANNKVVSIKQHGADRVQPTIQTDRGITIGSTAADVRRAYPELQGWQGPTEPFFSSFQPWFTNSQGHSIVFSFHVPGRTKSAPLPDDATVESIWITDRPGPMGPEFAFEGACLSH